MSNQRQFNEKEFWRLIHLWICIDPFKPKRTDKKILDFIDAAILKSNLDLLDKVFESIYCLSDRAIITRIKKELEDGMVMPMKLIKLFLIVVGAIFAVVMAERLGDKLFDKMESQRSVESLKIKQF